MAATDYPFIFNETTADFQELSIQGQLTYRVIDPTRLSAMLDFSVKPNLQYRTDDPLSFRSAVSMRHKSWREHLLKANAT